MTNDNTRTKANAVFFAAVMVISMVAVGFAAAPAAAVDSPDTVTFNDQALGADGSVTVSINDNTGGTVTNGTIAITYTVGGNIYLAGKLNVSGSSQYNNAQTVAVENTTGFPGVHTAHIFSDNTSLSGVSPGDQITAIPGSQVDTDTAIVSDTDAEITGDTRFQGQELFQNVTGQFSDGPNNLELRDIENTDSGPNDVGGLEQALTTETENGISFVTIETDDLSSGLYAVTNQTSGATVKNETTFELVTQSVSAEFADSSVGNVIGEEEVDFDITSSQRNTYDVNVSADGDLDSQELEDIFTSSGTFADSEITQDSEDDHIIISDAEGEDLSLNFTNIDAGEYNFTVSVDDTTAEDTASITVEDVDDGSLGIEESSLTVTQGDIVEFTVTAEGAASTGQVLVGNESDFGYEAPVTINDFGDDDEITLAFNTYTAGLNESGANAAEVVTIVDTDDDDDDITVADDTNLTDILASGDYDVSVGSGTTQSFDQMYDSSDDVATLFIEERSEPSIQLWTASDDNADEIIDADDDEQLDTLTGAIESDLVTQTNSVAYGDYSVHQISADGLEGALALAEDRDSSADTDAEQFEDLTNDNDLRNNESHIKAASLNNDTFLQFELVETSASAGPNADGITVTPTGYDLVVDEEDNEYYVLLDTNNLPVANDEDFEFDVELTVQNQRLLNPDDNADQDEFEDSYNTVSAPLSIEERTAEFDQDPYNLTNAENQTVTGTTNVAPATEFTVRARSDSGTQPSFVKTASEVSVAADGSFEAGFDFSDTNVDDEYTLSVQQLSLNDDVEADGTVVEQVVSPATFTVSDLSPAEATATAGDSVTVSATVENTGEAEATQSVALTLDGDELDSQDVTLAGGESTTVEFTADTSGLDAGDYTHGVATDDDEATGTLTIEAASDDGDDGEDGEDGTDGEDGEDGEDGMDGEDGEDGTDGEDGGDGGTDDSTPGFGALVALVALIAAALLATRRNE